MLITSCAVRVPLSKEYWNKPSKVGLFVNVNDPAKFRKGSQGLLDLALTSGDKYAPPLLKVNEKLNPKDSLVNMYTNILSVKGKEVVLISDTFNAKTAEKFKGTKVDGKKYSDYDFTYLKNKYGVDEVLFVNLNWGLMISYYGMIEIGRESFCYFDTRLVNTTDNSLYLANDNSKYTMLKGKWDVKPEYENVVSTVKISLNEAIETEKELFK
jgi:hypothetical protein